MPHEIERSKQSRRLFQKLETLATPYDLVPTSHRLRADDSPPDMSLSSGSFSFPRFNVTKSQVGGAIEMRLLAYTHHLAGPVAGPAAGPVAGPTLHEP